MNTNTATEYRNLPLAVLTESATNPRRIFEDSALKELAESIRSQGVLSPLLVRPLTDQSFEIVAGARRYRAAQMAEAPTVPVRIVNLTDAEALEAQLIENLQRRDVHPLEEAQGFKALLNLEDPKYSIEQIAAKVGKSPAYCAARVRLTELAAPVVEAFYAEEIGVGHALLLAKLQPAQQEQALANCFREEWNGAGAKAKRILLPVRHLQQWIEHNVLLLLKQAPFNKRDPQLVPAAGSCVDCPKRTGHNKLLFADVSGNTDACTDPNCYAAKLDAHVKAKVAAKPELVQISTAYKQQPEGEKTIPRNKYVEIRRGEARHAGESEVAGVQDVQVHHRSHRVGRHRQGRIAEGLHRANLPGTPSQEADAEGRCQLQSRAGEAPPRGGTGERNRNPRPAIHRGRRSRSADEARPALCCRTVAPVAGRKTAGDGRTEPEHQGEGRRVRRQAC